MKDHTESVLIEFNKSILDYETILHKWRMIASPYETKRQYRTAIFYMNDAQAEVAQRVAGGMEHVDVEKATIFWLAEQRHQDFLSRL